MSKQPIPETWLAPWNGPLRGFLFGLAPDGVFRASAIALGAVSSYLTFSPLLRRRHSPAGRSVFCGTIRRDDSHRHLPCVSRGSRYRVTWHRALWSSDFPPPTRVESDPPPFQNQRQVTCRNRLRQAANRCLPIMVSGQYRVRALPRTIPAPRNAQSTRPGAGLFYC